MKVDSKERVRVQAVSPYLYYADLRQALGWLERAFGFIEDVRYEDAQGIVQEAEMLAGDSRLMMGGCAPGADDGPGQLLIVYVDDVDAQHRKMVNAGVECDAPVDQSYGARTCVTTDPWGYKWSFWQRTGCDVELPDGWREIRK